MLGIFASCNSTDKAPKNSTTPTGTFEVATAFTNLAFAAPIERTSPNDNTDRISVASQTGLIHVSENQGKIKSASIFLDLSSRLVGSGERVLLGLAFHPDYKTNGYFYINYTKDNKLVTVIARFKVRASNRHVADPESALILLKYTPPFSNHNGGKVAFGNDGYRYIGSGDGGSGGDPGNRAQNRKELLGKILRTTCIIPLPAGTMQYLKIIHTKESPTASLTKSMPMVCVTRGDLALTNRAG